MKSQETHDDVIRKSIVFAALSRSGTVQNCTPRELMEQLDLTHQMSLSQFEDAMAVLTSDRQVRAPLSQQASSLQEKKFLYVEAAVNAEALI